VGGVDIGTIATNGDGTGGHNLVVDFNANATATNVSTLVDALTYSNSNNADPSSAARTVSVTVNDGDGGTSTAALVTINVVPVNDPPTLSATGTTTTYAENGPGVDLFSSVSASTVESGQNINQVTLTVSNLSDGASEILHI